jgi:hypothetical protein
MTIFVLAVARNLMGLKRIDVIGHATREGRSWEAMMYNKTH